MKPATGNGRICESYVLKIYVSRLRELDVEMFGNSSFAEFRERLVQAATWTTNAFESKSIQDIFVDIKKVVLPTRAPPNPPSVQIPLSSTEREQARFLNSTFSTPYLPYLISQYKKYIKIYVAISAP